MTSQIALVTGGMGGIGEAIAVKLHDTGYTTVVTYSPANTGAHAWLERMQAAYAHAIGAGYRFYSYGDASLLLPKT